MALLNNMKFIVLVVTMATIFVSNVDAEEPGDVQKEIELIQEDIKGIKSTEEMTKMTMMAFMGQVKGVDSRVTSVDSRVTSVDSKVASVDSKVASVDSKVADVVKESTLVSARLEKLATREDSDHKDVNLKIKQLTENVEADTEKIETLAKNAQKDHKDVSQSKEKITELTRNAQEDHKDINLNKEKIDALDHLVSEKLKNITLDFQSKEDNLEQTIELLKGEMRELKERGMVDQLHPVGSIYITFTNNEPPMNNQFGITWELLPEGYVLMSASKNNVGSNSGEQRIDGGATNGHTLTVAEMPSHSHDYNHYDQQAWAAGGRDGTYAWNHHTSTTSSTGGDSPHHHQLNIYNTKVMVWRRKS